MAAPPSEFVDLEKWVLGSGQVVGIPLSIYDRFILRNSNEAAKILKKSTNRPLSLARLRIADPEKPFPIETPGGVNELKKVYRESRIPLSFLGSVKTEAVLRRAIAFGGFDPTTLSFLTTRWPFLKNEIDKGDLLPSQKSLPMIDKITDERVLFPIKFLGRGAYGVAFVVWIWDYGKAVLKLPVSRELFWPFQRETEVLKLIECSSSSGSLSVMCARRVNPQYVFTDYYDGFVDLKKWSDCIKNYYLKSPIIDSPEIVSIISTIFRQIAEGIRYLHSIGIVHRDIKPANILVKWDIPMIIDFGTAMSDSGKGGSSFAGSPNFIPRDIWTMKFLDKLTGKRVSRIEIYSAYLSADAYALGMTLFKILQRKSPFLLPGNIWKHDPKTIEEMNQGLDQWFNRPIPKLKIPAFQEICEGLLAPLGQRWDLNQAIEFFAKLE